MNKPVAVVDHRQQNGVTWLKIKKGRAVMPDHNTLLYTHPAKCGKCNDTEWVCENHPDQEAHKCIYCEGAGKPCECTHPAKELHLSLQKSKETGELLAVTYTDDEHRIVEVLWKKPPAKTLTDEEIGQIWKDCMESPYMQVSNPVGFARAILRKASE